MQVTAIFRKIILTILFLFSLTGVVQAQDSGLSASLAQLQQAEAQVRTADRSMDAPVDGDARRKTQTRLSTALRSAESVNAALRSRLELIDERISGLGPPSDGAAETMDLKKQRLALSQERSTVDAAIKRATLIGVEAQQLLDEIAENQVEQFNARLSARSPSPLTPAFWRELLHAFPRDTHRIHLFLSKGTSQLATQWRGGIPWQAAVGAILALLLLIPLRSTALALGRRYLIDGAPGHRLRRSANALWRVLVGTLAPLLAASIFVQGLDWSGLLPDRWASLMNSSVVAIGFGSYTAAVLGSILMRSTPSGRVAPIDDTMAVRLRPLSWLLAGLSAATVVLTSFNTSVGASLAAQTTTQAALALLHITLFVAFLYQLARMRAQHDENDLGQEKARAGLGALMLIGWVVAAGTLLALLMGYVALSIFMMQFIAWAAILGATIYMLTVTVDDLANSVFVRGSRLGTMMSRAFGIRGSSIDQFGVILSAFVRLLLVILGLALLLSPFGSAGGVGAMFGRLGTLSQGVEVGGVAISPGAILRGVIVLLIGLALVRGFMGWLETRYLPATDLDGSGRNSVTLVARYVAVALAVVWALASLGVGIERIALLLSALSVGIGFGLQAITQNFVSGLILLAERPIKIGDLIRVGDDEGDVKRISVRSTEIELGDHSTLIVPNSELITKSVLNKTVAGTLGRVQLQFSVPIETDADKIRHMVLAIFAEERAVLDNPAPVVFIDAIADGRILFNSFAHVATPRATYGARSNILLALLQSLRDSGVSIGTVPQRLELVTPAAAPEPPPAKPD